MSARKSVVLIGGVLKEIPATDGISGAIMPNSTGDQTLATMQPQEFAIDSATAELVVRIGALVWRFTPTSASSYPGKLDFSIPHNSHWVGVMA